MLIYLTKTTLLMAIALILYKLLLENTTAHRFKRFYLLTTIVLAFALPSFSFSFFTASDAIHQSISRLDEVVIQIETTRSDQKIDFALELYMIYSLGVVWMATKFAQSLMRMYRLKKQGTLITHQDHTVVLLANIQTAFTFGKWVFVPLNMSLTTDNPIYRHELEHVKQKHSWDIVFIEVLKVVFWFHPLFYFYKTYIALNHEFLADQQCVQTNDQANDYLQLLLQQTYLQHNNELSSAFNFNLTKKRFIMIKKKHTPWQNGLAIAITTGLFLTVGTLAVKADTTNPVSKTETVQEKDLQHAEYIGGMAKFNQDFIAQFEYPDLPDEVKSVRIIVKLIVTKDGTLDKYELLRDEYQLGEKVIEVIKKMPKWQPAIEKGKAVNSEFTLPITIQTSTKE